MRRNRFHLTNTDNEMTIAEYFAGIGLMRMGLEDSGWRVVFANDIEKRKKEMYCGFFPGSETEYLVRDVFDLSPQDVPSAVLATCSFPCIDLSLAGNMAGMNGRHSSAFWGFYNVLRNQGLQAPQILLVENVMGWLSSNGGNDFRITIESLNKLGYYCDAFVLDAARFTPQSRQRVFVIGTKTPAQAEGVTTLLDRGPDLMPSSLRRRIEGNQDLLWFGLELPEPPSHGRIKLFSVIERLADDDERWWPKDKVKKHLNMMNARHRELMLLLKNSRHYRYRTFFRRIREGRQTAEVRQDDIAGCLRTAIGGSGRQFLVRFGYGEIRMRGLTAREYARLQGVPDAYPIVSPEVFALTCFGDAVCVPVISWIAKNALSQVVEVAEFAGV